MVNLILLLILSLDKLFQDTERFSNLTTSMIELPTVTKLFNIFCKLHRRYVILNSHKYLISKTFFFFCIQKVLSLETPLLPFFVPVPIRHTLSPPKKKNKTKKNTKKRSSATFMNFRWKNQGLKREKIK